MMLPPWFCCWFAPKKVDTTETLFETLLFADKQRQIDEVKQNDLVRLRRKSDGATLLIVASVAGDLQLVQLLLDLGACPKESDDSGNTALLVACFGGHHYPTVKALMESSSNANAKLLLTYANKEGTTPVAAAAWRGRLPILQFLVAQGGALDSVDARGRTPRELANEWGHKKVVAWIDEQKNT